MRGRADEQRDRTLPGAECDRPHHQISVRRGTELDRVEDLADERHRIGHRRCAARRGAEDVGHPPRQVVQRPGGEREERLDVRRGPGERCSLVCGPPGLLGGRLAQHGGGGDRPGDEPGDPGRAEQREDRPTPRGLSCQGDPIRITTERVDVVADPLEGGEPVEECAVLGCAAKAAEPKEPEPVADRDDDDGVPVECRAVVPGAHGRPRDVGPAVEIHQYGEVGTWLSGRGREDVDGQVVVAGQRRLGDGARVEPAALCRGTRSGGVADSLPAVRRGRCGKHELSHGRCRVRQAVEGRGPRAFGTAHDPVHRRREGAWHQGARVSRRVASSVMSSRARPRVSGTLERTKKNEAAVRRA